MKRRLLRRLCLTRALVALLAMTTLIESYNSARAATTPWPGSVRVTTGRPLAVNVHAVRSGSSAVEQNTDADDGAVQDIRDGVSFGRALDLQGSPLRLASAKPKNAMRRLFTPDLYSGPFVQPSGLPVRANSVSSAFGTRWHPLLGGYRFHAGIDLVAPVGTQIVATSPGIVAEAGWCSGYGYCVTVDHGKGYHTLYGHLSRVDVVAGDRVSIGQRLGLVGSTGLSTGPHLHYEVRVNGRSVDPRAYLRQ